MVMERDKKKFKRSAPAGNRTRAARALLQGINGRRAFYHWTTGALMVRAHSFSIILLIFRISFCTFRAQFGEPVFSKAIPTPIGRNRLVLPGFPPSGRLCWLYFFFFWFMAKLNKKSPMRGIEPRPRRWKRRILTTRPQGTYFNVTICLCYSEIRLLHN